jgi:hypothetical protein
VTIPPGAGEEETEKELGNFVVDLFQTHEVMFGQRVSKKQLGNECV